MADTLQTAVLPLQDHRSRSAVAALAALGVVYGDIGTSTLYGLKQAVEAGGAPAPETVIGVVSVILWSLIIIVALKYAILILRADNHGEGGIVALLALLDARHAPRGSWRASLLVVGLDRGGAAVWRWRDHAGDFGSQRGRRTQDRRAGAGADGGSDHHRDPDRAVSGAAQRDRVYRQHLRTGHAGLVRGDRSALGIWRIMRAPGILVGDQSRIMRLSISSMRTRALRFAVLGAAFLARDRGGGDVCRHGAFRPGADPAWVVRGCAAGADAELFWPGRAAAGRPERGGESVLSAGARGGRIIRWWRSRRSPR